MRACLPILLLATPLFAQQPAPEKLCSIEGQVTNSVTGAPVKKADLVLKRLGQDEETNYSATSGLDGKFVIRDIPPGQYYLTVEANGYVRTEYGARHPGRRGTPLKLDAGTALTDINSKLIPQGAIAGTVFDEDGDPVANADVVAVRYPRMRSLQTGVPGSASTNDLGEYRIFGLPPGKYNVAAVDNRSATTYVQTYYPSSIDRAAGAILDVSPGAVLGGVNIGLAKTHTVRVRGLVNNLTGQPLNGMIVLRPRDRLGPESSGGVGFGVQGSFAMQGVRPGAYRLEIIQFGNPGLTARQPLDVGDVDMDDVVATLAPGVDLPGQIKIPDGVKVDLAKIRVSLWVRDETMHAGALPTCRVQEDGTFTLPQVTVDHYDLDVSGLPENYYVKSIRAQDQEIREAGLDMTNGPPGPITITIAPGAGQIDGLVVDSSSTVAGAAVVLIPNDPQRRARSNAYHDTKTDQNGLFTMHGIEPGDYKLFAWDDIEPHAYEDPSFLKPFEDRGTDITIKENSHENVQLKVIPAE